MDKINLQNKFLDFGESVDKYCHSAKSFYTRPHLRQQLLNSSSSALLNFGEAKMAESRKDYAHKLSISLKELSETYLGLKLMERVSPDPQLKQITRDTEELLRITKAIVNSLRKNSR